VKIINLKTNLKLLGVKNKMNFGFLVEVCNILFKTLFISKQNLYLEVLIEKLTRV